MKMGTGGECSPSSGDIRQTMLTAFDATPYQICIINLDTSTRHLSFFLDFWVKPKLTKEANVPNKNTNNENHF
jgi:hypothetical protein